MVRTKSNLLILSKDSKTIAKKSWCKADVNPEYFFVKLWLETHTAEINAADITPTIIPSEFSEENEKFGKQI